MWELLSLLFAAALVNNFVLVQFLGLCPLLGTSKSLETAVPMGLATIFVITISTILTHTLHNLVLVPLDLTYLRIVVFIVSIASVVQLTELYIRHTSPLLNQLLGVYLPLITSNCAVLGVALTVAELTLVEAILVGAGASLGFVIVLVLFAGLRERLEQSNVPAAFRGTPLALITAGFMALAFTGFRGMF